MNYCTSCGTRYGEYAVTFCTACGVPRAAHTPSTRHQAQVTRTAPADDVPVNKPITAIARSRSQVTGPSTGNSSAGAFLALGLLFVAIVAIAVTFATKTPTAAAPPPANPIATASSPAPTMEPTPSAAQLGSATSGNPAILACQASIPGTNVVSVGDQGDDVQAVQWALATLKYETYDGSGQLLPVTGDYDSQTSSAVGRFQRNHKLPTTGSVDQPTWTAIYTQLQTWGSPAAC